MQASNSLRKTEITVFCAYIAFVVAGLYFYAFVDDSQFIPLMHSHIELAAAWLAIAGGAAIALAAVVIGGLPIGYAVVRDALVRNRRRLLLLAVPVITFCVLVAVVALVYLAYGTMPTNTMAFPIETMPFVAVGFGALFIVAAVVSVAAVCIAVVRSEVDEETVRLPGITIVVQPYRFALLPAAFTVLAMLVMLAATVAWGLIARSEAPGVFDGDATTLSWVGIVAVMGISTVVAGVTLARGLAQRNPDGA